MAQKIRGSLSDPQFAEFCERLRSMPGGRKVTFTTIQALAAEYGITVSHMGAKTFREGPFARYLDKLHRSRETREALVEATAGGAQTLDALEEVAVLELQDHLTESEEIDVEWVASQLVKLRSAISMREDSRRKDRDLDRKLRETEKKLELAEQQRTRLAEQNAKLVSDREAREAALRTKAEAAGAAINKPKASADDIRKQAVALIDEVMGIKPKAPKA